MWIPRGWGGVSVSRSNIEDHFQLISISFKIKIQFIPFKCFKYSPVASWLAALTRKLLGKVGSGSRPLFPTPWLYCDH